ncbi:unnamed protein product [Diabrotica balteata]|uniref:DUF4371 domain-containing protein n=1 Tax=Diabrotica balteata TaxID=107213 RepID=A0A9N9TFZ4_DIABA|nr:unnamed protein product [Diabrotica balteata]
MGKSFRGHRDFGPFDLNVPPQRGEGNFRSHLKFTMDSGDHILAKNLVKRVNEAKFFSILCDETTDISSTIQLSFCARFVENNKFHEELLQFIQVTETTETRKDLGLNENKIHQLEQKPKVEILKRLCATRWIKRHDLVHTFIFLLPVIIKALDVITNWSDNKTATDAQLLSAAICKCESLESLCG